MNKLTWFCLTDPDLGVELKLKVLTTGNLCTSDEKELRQSFNRFAPQALEQARRKKEGFSPLCPITLAKELASIGDHLMGQFGPSSAKPVVNTIQVSWNFIKLPQKELADSAS